jgi:hypothetical protein
MSSSAVGPWLHLTSLPQQTAADVCCWLAFRCGLVLLCSLTTCHQQQLAPGCSSQPCCCCCLLLACSQVWPGPAVFPDYMSSSAVGPWLILTTPIWHAHLTLLLFAAGLLSGVAWPCRVPRLHLQCGSWPLAEPHNHVAVAVCCLPPFRCGLGLLCSPTTCHQQQWSLAKPHHPFFAAVLLSGVAWPCCVA